MRVLEAGRREIEEVLRSSHALWGEGMRFEDYLAFNLAQRTTPWGRERHRFMVGLDEAGGILSSLKLYALEGEIDSRRTRIAGIGAVFTPPEFRGRGHAAALIEAVLERARAEGCGLALLMSEIGEAYYARLGFRALPGNEAACVTALPAPWPKEPAWMRAADPLREVAGLRPFRPEDLDDLLAIRASEEAGRRLRIDRDRPSWEQILMKMEMGTRLRGDGADLLWVVESAGRVQAYAILKETPKALRWREHGAGTDREGSLADLFWCALAWARRRGLPRLEGWFLPPAVTTGPLYPIARRPRGNPVVMLRALDPAVPLPEFSSEEECRVAELDSF